MFTYLISEFFENSPLFFENISITYFFNKTTSFYKKKQLLISVKSAKFAVRK